MLKILLVLLLVFTNAPIQYTATAYAIHGRTATGQRTRHGIVAADPRILPYGTRIAITEAGELNGVYTVADTGGAIKGRRLDIWVSSIQKAKRFGRRKIKVRRL
jgi:3D (Asp-Asp-Asp) domain-containing protein